MLALQRSARVAHRFTLHARTLSTVAAHDTGAPDVAATVAAESPSDPAPSDNVAVTARRRRTTSADFMLVYPWNGIRSSADGLSIARAVQDKYGPAKEVIFPRDSDSIHRFQPYFFLVFDNPDVRKLLPEASTQLSVQVTDLPRGDGNVGIDAMMRGLGLSTDETNDAPREPPTTPTESEASKDTSDAPPGYKTLDVRIEWARYGPAEVLKRKRHVSRSLPPEDLLPQFADAWLAFDGFSPESARGPNTPNLLHAREKWRSLASASVSPSPSSSLSSSSVRGAEDDLATTTADAAEPPSSEPIEVRSESDKESASSASLREWVPIIPGGAQRPHTSFPLQKAASVSASVSVSSSIPPTHDDIAEPTDPERAPVPLSAEEVSVTASASSKMSRRERILHLARQNARTPLPEPVKVAQPPSAEAEKGDEESERHMKERTIRERLWRLVGGNY